VTLTHGLYVQATEVTNQQYRDAAQWAYDNGYVTADGDCLYDMHGNLWEWCNTSYGPYGGTVVDPVVAGSAYRVLRGGRWSSHAQYCRSASRYYYRPDTAIFSVGFRPVRSAS
jgi:formylglycine-generating enzyme required for sulfatase activity